MFPRLLQLIVRRPPPASTRRFVEAVHLAAALPPRHRPLERWLLLGWIAIAVKCWLVVWLVGRYHMPFNPLWVTAPTIAFALMVTAAYFFRE